ncbi:MAG: hypothetical protein COA44_03245 [Arcobacter sp.]|nr:MAG: hypothetical protein COA44_03245 [Arcobacter sp.]
MGCKISGFENGPLEVDCENVEFIQDGKKLEVKNPSYLCRCGHSKSKPFCDGTHAKVDFESKREISEEVLQNYEGKELSIHFNRSICSGSSHCVHGLGSVFKSGDNLNWIDPNAAKAENIIKQIKACPSGALSYSIKNEVQIDSRHLSKIEIIKNGPYNVEGINLEGFDFPTKFSATKYTLCRCGYSKNKPFCDYSHAEKNWKD